MTATRNRSIVLMGVVVCSLLGSASVNSCDRLCDREWMSSATVKDVQIEIEKRADLMSRIKKEFTALHVAASVNPDPDVISFLVEAGADLHVTSKHSEKLTPLHLASGGEGPRAQSYFILALVTYMNDLGRLLTLEEIRLKERKLKIETRILGNTYEIVEVLVNYGANIDARDAWDASPLHYAAGGNMDPRVVKLLLEGGASVDAQNKDGWTPLHIAASFNSNPAISELLIDYGADMEARTIVGTPLHHAAMNWNPEISELLLRRGADIEARNEEMMTPLHMTAKAGFFPYIAELLLDHNADLESTDIKNRTPLHIAMKSGITPFVAIELVERGANMDARDKEGRSPRNIIEMNRVHWFYKRYYEHLLNFDVQNDG